MFARLASKALLAFLFALPAGHAAAQDAALCVTSGTTHCPYRIINHSKAFTADQIQVLATAALVTGDCKKENGPPCPWSFVGFDAAGVGTLVPATEGQTSLGFARRLSDFPMDGADTYVLKMPRHDSGRVYVTIGDSITTTVIGSGAGASISDPNISTAHDPNYYRIYDKFESTYLPYVTGTPGNNPLFINITSVDFVSIPMALTLDLKSAAKSSGPVGYVKSRATINETLATYLVGEGWPSLLQGLDGNLIRVVAPNKGLETGERGDPGFPTDYFDGYLRRIWAHYSHATEANRGNTLTIDATEILPAEQQAAGKTLKYMGYVDASPCPVEISAADMKACAPYSGHSTVTNAFCFKKVSVNGLLESASQPDFIPVLMPTTESMISGDKELCAPNKTPRSIIARDLNALLNRGLLPIAGATTVNDKDRSATGFWPSHKPFYNFSPWPTTAKTDYNAYARVLHGLATGGIYAFAFDDVGGDDSTLSDNSAVAATITIQDMSGTAIPDPTRRDPETTKYDVTIAPPGSYDTARMKYRHDGKDILPGKPLTLSGTHSPVRLDWVVDGVVHPLEIHLRTAYVMPPPLGNRTYNIGITDPGSPGGMWTIGLSDVIPSPWPAGLTPLLTQEVRETGRVGTIVLQQGVDGRDYGNVPADWYLWVETATGKTFHYGYDDGTSQWKWFPAATASDVKAFNRGVPLPKVKKDTGTPTLPKEILSLGDNRIYFGVNTSTQFGHKDSGTLFSTMTPFHCAQDHCTDSPASAR